MKRAWMMGAATAVLFAVGCSSEKAQLADDFTGDLAAADGKADTINTSKLKLVGSLDYGQTSSTVKYDGKTRYLAFKFGGGVGDQVVIDVTSANGDSYAWLTDNLGKVIAKNDDYNHTLNSHIAATLPANKDASIITYYIVFTEYYGDPASFKVSLKGTKPAPPDYFSCKQDSDCVAEPQGGCCPHGYKVAVNKNEVTAWETTQTCTTTPHPICPLYLVDDLRVSECNGSTHQCEMVNISDIACGGKVIVPHSCPTGYECQDPAGVYDGTGSCVQKITCGGIAGIQCPTGMSCVDDPNDNCDPANGGADCSGMCVQKVTCGGISGKACPSGMKCVDDPSDNCDPANGGADCGGMCVACIDNVLCVNGSHWDAASCGCVKN